MKIDMNKKYRFRDAPMYKFLGLLTILEEDQTQPVIGLMQREDKDIVPGAWCADGRFLTNGHEAGLDLIEVNEWDYLEIDDQVLVKNSEIGPWIRRYFAGIENGMPMIWDYGGTSWSGRFKAAVKFCVPAGKIPEEFHTRSLRMPSTT